MKFAQRIGLVLGILVSSLSVSATHGQGIGLGPGMGIKADGACLAGTCPPPASPANTSNLLPFSFVVTKPNGDRFRVTGSSGTGGNGFACGGSQNIGITYLGNTTPVPSQADTITLNGLWACEASASSINVTHPFTVHFSSDVAASSSVVMTPIYNSTVFTTQGPFAPYASTTVGDFRVVPNGTGVFSSDTSYIVTFGAGSAVGSSIWVGYSTAQPNRIVSAVLPSARTSSQSGAAFPTITAFATIINTDTSVGTACSLSKPAELQGSFLFQTTNPVTNTPIGTPNTPVDVPAGGSQTFYFAITPTAAFSTDIPIHANCLGKPSPGPLPSVNTLLLTSSTTPIADMVSIGLTPSGDGIVRLPSTSGTQFFAISTLNIATAATITLTPTDTAFGQPPRNLPVNFTICQTNLQGACLQPASASVTTSAPSNTALTFTIFATGQGQPIALDPARNRVFLYLRQGAQVVGATSAAIRTP